LETCQVFYEQFSQEKEHEDPIDRAQGSWAERF
jgi:hypothetical protein